MGNFFVRERIRIVTVRVEQGLPPSPSIPSTSTIRWTPTPPSLHSSRWASSDQESDKETSSAEDSSSAMETAEEMDSEEEYATASEESEEELAESNFKPKSSSTPVREKKYV